MTEISSIAATASKRVLDFLRDIPAMISFRQSTGLPSVI